MTLLSRAKAMPLPEPEYPAVRLGINRDKLAFTADQLRAAREQVAAEADGVIERLREALDSIASMYDYEASCGDLASRLYEASRIAVAALAEARKAYADPT